MGILYSLYAVAKLVFWGSRDGSVGSVFDCEPMCCRFKSHSCNWTFWLSRLSRLSHRPHNWVIKDLGMSCCVCDWRFWGARSLAIVLVVVHCTKPYGFRSYTVRHCNKTVRNRSPTVVQTQQHPTLTVDIRPGVVRESYWPKRSPKHPNSP